MSIRIQGFEGSQYSKNGPEWEKQDYKIFNQQYATSSYQIDHNMFPALIVKPKGDEDVKKAVKWAVANKVAVAVKSGGHQYSGASSTGDNNIQIDLSDTYKDLAVKEMKGDTTALVLAGVSNRLKDFNAYLTGHGLFVPTGQCAYVGIGGHVQTGGYGQLGRGFGLIGDHIRMVRMVCHDGEIREFGPGADQQPDIFNAILGGSPGNFGIITHYLIEVHQDKHHTSAPDKFKQGGPHGIKAAWVYSKPMLTNLLNEVADMAKDPNLPRGFDMCVSVFGAGNPLAKIFDELNDNLIWKAVENKIETALNDPQFFENLVGPPSTIILYAQWCPMSPNEKYDKSVDDWFQKFRKYDNLILFKRILFKNLDASEFPMSKMTGEWIMQREREFDLPYVKRTYATNSTTLREDGWVETVVDQIHRVCSRENNKNSNKTKPDLKPEESALYDNCKVVAQIQHFGGKNSQFAANANNGTSYSWRDTTVCQTLDCFYNEKGKALAEQWQKDNDTLMIGPKSSFSKQDRRVLWGSWGDWDLSKNWQCYYEDKKKYENIGKARAKADPNGTFTPNPFAVERFTLPN